MGYDEKLKEVIMKVEDKMGEEVGERSEEVDEG